MFVAVSLGQGQEPVAEKALEQGAANGGWVLLQNIELVARWLPKLEKKLEALTEGPHPDFRVFLSALPQKVVPVQILQNSIKLTNEPPSGLRLYGHMLRAYVDLQRSDASGRAARKASELKAITSRSASSTTSPQRRWVRPDRLEPRATRSTRATSPSASPSRTTYLETTPRSRGPTCATSSARSCTAATSPTPRTAASARLPAHHVREELLDQLDFFRASRCRPTASPQAVLRVHRGEATVETPPLSACTQLGDRLHDAPVRRALQAVASCSRAAAAAAACPPRSA